MLGEKTLRKKIEPSSGLNVRNPVTERQSFGGKAGGRVNAGLKADDWSPEGEASLEVELRRKRAEGTKSRKDKVGSTRTSWSSINAFRFSLELGTVQKALLFVESCLPARNVVKKEMDRDLTMTKTKVLSGAYIGLREVGGAGCKKTCPLREQPPKEKRRGEGKTNCS